MEGRELHLHLHLWKEASDASEASEAPEYFGLPAPVRPSNTSSQRGGLQNDWERRLYGADSDMLNRAWTPTK